MLSTREQRATSLAQHSAAEKTADLATASLLSKAEGKDFLIADIINRGDKDVPVKTESIGPKKCSL